MALIEKLENIGDAIRSKTGKTNLLTLDEMVTEIKNIETGGGSSSGGDIEEYFKTTMSASSYSSSTNWNTLVIKLPSPLTINSTNGRYNYVFYNFYGEVLPEFVFTATPTQLQSTFQGCSNILEIPYIDASSVTTINALCSGCKNLVKIPEMSLDSCTNLSSCLNNCSDLEDFGGFKNLGKGYTQKSANYSYYTFNLSAPKVLTHDSLMNVINNLYDLNLTYDVANGGTLYTQKLTLGSTNLAKLTAEEIAIATNKGWTVA
jgi:hypothetical protein